MHQYTGSETYKWTDTKINKWTGHDIISKNKDWNIQMKETWKRQEDKNWNIQIKGTRKGQKDKDWNI